MPATTSRLAPFATSDRPGRVQPFLRRCRVAATLRLMEAAAALIYWAAGAR